MEHYFFDEEKMAKIEHCVFHSQSNSLAAQTRRRSITREFSFALTSTCEKLEEDK